MDEDTARAHIRKALEKANDPKQPITTLLGFLQLVRDFYLAPKVYEQYENIIADMWSQRQTSCLLSPAESAIRYSSESEAGFVPQDSHDRLPTIEAEAKPIDIFIIRPNHADRTAYATYKECNTPGNYIRADSMRNNFLRDEGDSFVIVQWKPCGTMNNSNDHAATHTACRIVNEEEAESLGMNVDLVFGTDCKKELALQSFGLHISRKALKRPPSVVEEEEEEEGSRAPTLQATAASLSNQAPGIAHPEDSFGPTVNMYQPLIINGISDWTPVFRELPAMLAHLATARHDATAVPGNIVLDASKAEINGSNTPEESRKRRKVGD